MLPSFSSPEELSRRLAAARTPGDVQALLLAWDGGHEALFHQVAAETRVWEPSLVLALWSGCEGSELLLKNPHRTPEVNRQLAQWEFRRLMGGSGTRTQKAGEALSTLAREGSLPLDGDIFQAVESLLTQGARRKKLTDTQGVALRILLHHPHLPAERIRHYSEQLGERIGHDEALLMAGHPNTEERLRRELFHRTLDSHPTRAAALLEVMKHPLLIAREEFRAVLVGRVLQTSSWYPCRTLIELTPDDEERGRLLLAYLEGDPRGAEMMVLAQARTLVPRLPHAVVQELLTRGDASFRLRVMTALGNRPREISAPESPAPPAARPLRRR